MSRTGVRIAAGVVGITLGVVIVPFSAEAPGRVEAPAATGLPSKPAAPVPLPPLSPEPLSPEPTVPARALPLAGLKIALDPGHQLGNHNFPRQVTRPVPAGGFTKPCNTTGTETNAGLAEATVNWQIALLVRQRLRALGARVAMTRDANSERLWGPCVDERGEFADKVDADLMVSLHADGAASGERGFHVIARQKRAPYTSDVAAPSLPLARQLRAGLLAAGLPQSTYISGGISIRADLGTLNLSDVPVAMVEIGNMRNASDAARMASSTGRAQYADGIVNGIRRYLSR